MSSGINANTHTFANNLPPELLAEIFILAGRSPSILGKVCSFWQAIALSTPALWSRIFICVVSPTMCPKQYVNQLSFFKKRLARSGETPLTLRVQVKIEWDDGGRRLLWDGTNPIPIEFVRLLVDSAHRWQRVEFESIPRVWHPLLKEAVKLMLNPFPLLHTLKILPPQRHLLYPDEDHSDSDDEGVGSTPWRFDLFSGASALKTVELTCCRIAEVDVLWRQLTSLSLRGDSRRDCLYALHELQNLEYLEIYFPPYYNDSNQPPLGHFLQPVLKHLIIGYPPFQVLHGLTAPQLHTLELLDARALGIPDLLALPQLFSGSGCQLRRLKLCDIYISSKDMAKINIIRLLREISTLEELEIVMAKSSGPVADTDIFVELLKSGPGFDTHFLPNLTVFSYTGPIRTEYRFDQPIFHQLQFRHGSAAAERNLRSVVSFRVNASGTYSPFRSDAADLNRLLTELSESGLRFRFVCGKKVVF